MATCEACGNDYDKTMLGSVAGALVRSARCPVLVYHEALRAARLQAGGAGWG
jgi:hypothetical protein